VNPLILLRCVLRAPTPRVPGERQGKRVVIREERELLAELTRLNRDMAPLVMRIMDGTASVEEQHTYAQRLIAAGERLQRKLMTRVERSMTVRSLAVDH
jgi:hypothetical protein